MAKTHNKKRNVGLMYELLLRYISYSLVEDRKKDAQVALDIISERFSQDTELYKEFRLFNALAKSTVSDTAIAAAILAEAKSAARRFNMDALDKEKSSLIREVNYKLGDDVFYHRRLPDYKIYATIQTLINEWHKGDRSDLSRTVQYEGKIVEWLLSEKHSYEDDSNIDSSVDALAVKILTEKFNTRYGSLLNEEQIKIIRTYIFSMKENNEDTILNHLQEIKKNTLASLNEFKESCKNKILLEKIEKVQLSVNSLSCDSANDETIKRFLTISQLRSEIIDYGEIQNG